MSKNPYLNALAAFLYIIFVALFMFYGIRIGAPDNSIIIPIAMISLFTLSAAMMGYIFMYQPAQLLLDGKKKEALDLFLKTVAVFGLITFLVLLLFFSGIFPKL